MKNQEQPLNEKVKFGEADENQKNVMKNLHGSVYEVIVDTEDTRHYCYLKEPDPDKFGAITSKMKSDEFGGSKLLIDTCMVGGDPEFKTRVKLILGCSEKIGPVLQSVSSQIKKL